MKWQKFVWGVGLRAVTGVLLILGMNMVLNQFQVPLLVGVNPCSILVTCLLGIPGVLLLYGIQYFLFW